MKKSIKISALVFSLILAFGLFAGCQKSDKKTINVLNYGENIADGIIIEFEEKYNVIVNYE